MYARDGYSEAKKAIIHFTNDSAGLVSFPAFIKGFTLNTDYGVKLTRKSSAESKPTVEQIATMFNYSLTLQVPCYSVRESRESYEKFRNLINSIETATNPKSWEDYTTITHVLLANIIQSGLYKNSSDGERNITSASQVKKYGAKCSLTSLEFKPDLDMGFFEYDGAFTPKAFDISLKLNFNPNFIDGAEAKLSVAQFEIDRKAQGYWNALDTKCWPFGVTGFSKLSDLNNLLREKNGMDGSGVYATKKGAAIGFASNDVDRWVAFEAFVDSYSVKKEIAFNRKPNPQGGVTVYEIGGGVKDNSYQLSFNCVAHSVNEARANLKKIQDLIRYPIRGDDVESTGNGKIVVYFRNLIGGSKPLAFGDQPTLTAIRDYGILCAITKIDLAVDDELGYFDYNGFLFPKAFKVSMGLHNIDQTIDSPIAPTGGGGGGGNNKKCYEQVEIEGVWQNKEVPC
jgi:hypothetical protein